MCCGMNVGLDTRCVHRKSQVCRLSTKKLLKKNCAQKKITETRSRLHTNHAILRGLAK